MKKFVMGNEAIGLAAIQAGVGLVAGYPGTPSSEILETVAKNNPGDIYVEWSVNEKAAMELAAGASFGGARSMVTMKQVGLNVASDPLMSLAYLGVKGGMLVVVADDPGPISSQTEQDTRSFALFAKLPIFDPATPQEAYSMVEDAFALSEKYGLPVILRPTTRICHACADIDIPDTPRHLPAKCSFDKKEDWVIFPQKTLAGHHKLQQSLKDIAADFAAYPLNKANDKGSLGIVAGGVAYQYVKEALQQLGCPDVPLLRISTPHPLPTTPVRQFLNGLTEVLVAEELDPVLERALWQLVGQEHLTVNVRGKLSGDLPSCGEYSPEEVNRAVAAFLGLPLQEPEQLKLPPLPNRPPVLCAACPHRASFYAVKQAMRGQKAVFCGDIGCYTLGNAAPLNMVDTCLCMGADITVAQGLQHLQPDAAYFSFIGDSTFFASGISGVVNAVYNQSKLVLVVLDNSTTAMTGHQPHPGTGVTMMGQKHPPIMIEEVLRALGVPSVKVCDPFELKDAVSAVKQAAAFDGVAAVIFRSPCVAGKKSDVYYQVDEAICTFCLLCAKQLGCPAVSSMDGKVGIDSQLCLGCSLCAQICPQGAIKRLSKGGEA